MIILLQWGEVAQALIVGNLDHVIAKLWQKESHDTL